MSFIIILGTIALPPASVFAQDAATTVPFVLDPQAVIKELQEQIKQLQEQVASLKGELEVVKTELAITKTLRRGDTGDEVRKLQELLKSDPEIYPEGLVTGYFGPLTERAVKRFQEKHSQDILSPLGLFGGTGIVGENTIAILNKLAATPAVPATSAQPFPGEGIPAIPAKPAIPAIPAQQVPIAGATSTEPIVPLPTQTLPPPPPPPPPVVPTTTATTTVTTDTTATTTAETATTTTPTTTSPITVVWPNGGETLQYNLNYSIGYQSIGVSSVGLKLFKGSQIVWQTSSPTTVGTQLSMGLSGTVDSSAVGSGSDYKVRVFNWDNQDVYDESDNYFALTSADITPPVVSNVLASSITATSAVITWTTDEPGTGKVNYGPTSDTARLNWRITPQDTSYSTSHSFTLTNLSANTLYTYRVYSVDASGNGPEGFPPDHTFTTLNNGDTVSPTPPPPTTGESATSTSVAPETVNQMASILEATRTMLLQFLELLKKM